MTEKQADLAGGGAIFIWSLIPLVLTFCVGIPSFFLTGLTFFVGFLFFMFLHLIRRKKERRFFDFPVKSVVLPICGIGLYLVLYYTAIQSVPIIEVSLINYLWPALLMFFAGFLPNEKHNFFHLLGVLICFVGIYVLLKPDNGFSFEFAWGHVLAFFAAITWAIFSVVSRTRKQNSSHVIPMSYCANGLIFLSVSFCFEDISILQGADLLPVLLLGCCSGMSYFLWDIGMKHGNIKILTIATYFVPITSSLILFVFDKAEPKENIIAAMLLVTSGALVAAKDKLFRRKNAVKQVS